MSGRDGRPLLAFAVPFVMGCDQTASVSQPLLPPACYAPDDLGGPESLCAALPAACVADGAPPASGEPVTVVPSDAMPPEVVSQRAHNNLDLVWHRGRLFFAFRTAPHHFAHEDAVIYVVSTTDQQHWTFEARFALGTDVREPRLLSLGDQLLLYFAVLGKNPLAFEPQAMMVSEQLRGCAWTSPKPLAPTGEPGFIPWRARNVDGVGQLIGYVGGESIYQAGGVALTVHWLATADGRAFAPAAGDESAVLEGGASETDLTILPDGRLVAVARNEAGEDGHWGSKICRAEPGALGAWQCQHDPKKYDSPLVFEHDGVAYLIARRNVTDTGDYDLGYDELSPEEQSFEYEKDYWKRPKRCSLWRIDPDALVVTWLFDLPSAGDTCFASAVPVGSDRLLVYNYTSPVDQPDLKWLEGQQEPTSIYRLALALP